MNLSLQIKPFAFSLKRPLQTAQGILANKEGWLLKVTNSSGKCGWGEVSPIDSQEIKQCKTILDSISKCADRDVLEESITKGPGALGFGLGSALADLDEAMRSGPAQCWLPPPQSAILLRSGKSFLKDLESYLEHSYKRKEVLTFKLKVAIKPNDIERTMISKVLERLPMNYRLRLDANSGWDRCQALEWANYFLNDVRLEWIEQPLHTDDIKGLMDLAKIIPIALDESLIKYPALRKNWKSWQIRHPTLEGDPRVLLKSLQDGKTNIAISTAFETGIGRRWVNHLAAIQQTTQTPTAPGLAPGWLPSSNLFSHNPKIVWDTV
ncbi:o-succinylbenzoate synthase [Prochlorococcus sp. MIT 1223]|uniref:o-succinylbenzoate synthase n=1 Tax=Prochlorococcus sp. MIT 1223 TaxID=3096217 RepID=UPI002A75FFA8|nr:o-succinylbenzoate synthase [Prochlorococcus sp. MIT 1223]